MRILQSCYEFPPLGGGGSRVVDGLTRELARRGHEVHVVTMAFRDHPRTEVRDGVTIHRVPCLRRQKHRSNLLEASLYLLASSPVLRRLQALHDFDIHHAHFILPDGLNASRLLRRTGLPYVVTAHGSDVPGYNPHRLRVAHALSRRLWSRAGSDASVVVCPSEGIRTLLLRRAPLRTVVIPYGFEVGRYRTDGARLRRILVVARLLKRKGVQYLLRAVRDLDLGYEVHVVGDGPYRSRLQALAADSRSPIVFHGWLDNRSPELTRLYESSDIFVLMSERENFPVSLMEAMGAELAIVTTRGTGCAEVVGDAGVLVPPRSEPGLRAALLDLTADPERRRRLGMAARSRLEREFSWPVVADRYLELYESWRVPRDADT